MENTHKMSTQVGLISLLQGSASAVNNNGEAVQLKIDSPIFEGDQIIVSGQGAKAIVSTPLNQNIVLEEGSTTVYQSAIEQVEKLQLEILNNENFDFSELEATAAGPQTQTSLASPLIVEPLETVIEYHSSDTNNKANDTNQETNNDSSLRDISTENTQLTPSSPFIGQSFANVTEDLQGVFQGKVSSDSSFTPGTQTTTFGAISYDEQGNWQYTLNNELESIQALGSDDTLTESISLTAQNGGTFVIDVTINGSNDFASISGDTTHIIKEDFHSSNDNSSDNIAVSGRLNIQDSDSGEASFIANNQINTTYGSATVNSNGEWHYLLNNDSNAIQSLTNNTQLTDSFTVQSIDGTKETVQIAIQGTNDSPLLNGSNQATLNLETDDTVNGQLGINDPDFGESHFIADTNINTRFGSGSIEENGRWTYKADTENSEIADLEPGALLHDSFIVSTADGTEQTIIIPISNNGESISTASIGPILNEASAIIELSDNDDLFILNSHQENNTSSDLYIWNASNDDSTITQNTDSIAQFNLGSDGDILQLNDLLLDSEEPLDQFLHFSYDGKDTTIEINTHQEGADQHFLVMNNMDLTTMGNTDGEIIQNLLQQGNLDIAGL